jgi:hypothetical protein
MDSRVLLLARDAFEPNIPVLFITGWPFVFRANFRPYCMQQFYLEKIRTRGSATQR